MPNKKDVKNSLLFMIGLIVFIGIIKLIVGYSVSLETPNERAERINRMADRECTNMPDEMSRMCFESYYSTIETRL